jgi:preprotein translocase subunit SecA
MTARPALEMIRTRHAVPQGEGDAPAFVWGQGTLTSANPSGALLVLANHREDPYQSPFDRWGAFGATLVGRLARPMPRYRRLAKRVLTAAEALSDLSDPVFDVRRRAAIATLRTGYLPDAPRISAPEITALSFLADAVRRVHGFRPHPEQIVGAIALLEGAIAEMATGEGKTLTAAIAASVAAWRGLPVHVVTSNDYLAARDCEIGQPLFALCGVTAAAVTVDTPPGARGQAYAHDIVYTTAQNILADHLRDGLALSGRSLRVRVALLAARAGGAVDQSGVVQRGTHQIIVDEADSVLIDEAITPLIISAEKPDTILESAALQAAALAGDLQVGPHVTVDATLRTVDLTESGRLRLHGLATRLGPFWQRTDRAEELVQMALYATHLMVQDQHYVVEDGEVVLVDELTGRLARQRTLSLGMQQVLEATLGLKISPPSEVQARQSFQRYFRRLPKVGGMTGTAQEARAELARTYGLGTLAVPTHKPSQRRHLPRRSFATAEAKRRAVVRDALALSAQGRAVLIGVRSVQTSDALGETFRILAPGHPLAVLNAVNDAEESAIVARAGQSGAITIATNMAGRGTDIKIDDRTRALGGLHVMVAEINDFSRIDRQLVGRCARQGDPGTVQVYVSPEDDLFRRFLPGPVMSLWRGLGGRVLSGVAVGIAQTRAEHLARKQRKASLDAEIEIEKATI